MDFLPKFMTLLGIIPHPSQSLQTRSWDQNHRFYFENHQEAALIATEASWKAHGKHPRKT